MERANHPHPVWAVCGYSDAAVCAVILEEDGQSECSDAPVRVGCGLFPGAVHTHRFPGGGIQLVSSPGAGAELCRAVPERSPAEKTAKKGESERMKRNKKVVIGCSIVAAICFGIVSYGNFYRGRMALGWTFAILTAAQLALAVMNYILSKKIDDSESVSEDTQ